MNFLTIILIHFLADFGLQTHDQAQKKSTDEVQLFYHVGVYSLIWFIFLLPFYHPILVLFFSFITLILHYTTDYITSRIAKSYFQKEDYHNAYVVIGFDQVLHYIQLYYTLELINYLK